MPKGRKPKPDALKALDGNPGKRPFVDPATLAFSAAPPLKRPRHITGRARTEWERIVTELERLGLAGSTWQASLEAYCTAYALWRTAKDQLLKKDMPLLITTKSGYPVQNPLIGIVATAAAQMRAWLIEFGLTPTARTRVGPVVQPQGDALDDFMAGANTKTGTG